MAKLSVLSVDKIVLVLLIQANFANCFFIKTVYRLLDALINCGSDYDDYYQQSDEDTYSVEDEKEPPGRPVHVVFSPEWPYIKFPKDESSEKPYHIKFPKDVSSERPYHIKFPKDDSSERPYHIKFPKDESSERPYHIKFPKDESSEWPYHIKFPKDESSERPYHIKFPKEERPEWPYHIKFPPGWPYDINEDTVVGPCDESVNVGIITRPCYDKPPKGDPLYLPHPSTPPKQGSESLIEGFVMTWPGTKWCGPGNFAANYSDLGEYRQTDKCCRTHDHCADKISPGCTAHGLANDGFYVRLSCKCDGEFHKCLHKAKDGLAKNIGKLYFDIIGTKCFRLDYPIVKCIKYRGTKRPKCLEYEVDRRKDKIYQWFDVPPFRLNT